MNQLKLLQRVRAIENNQSKAKVNILQAEI